MQKLHSSIDSLTIKAKQDSSELSSLRIRKKMFEESLIEGQDENDRREFSIEIDRLKAQIAAIIKVQATHREQLAVRNGMLQDAENAQLELEKKLANKERELRSQMQRYSEKLAELSKADEKMEGLASSFREAQASLSKALEENKILKDKNDVFQKQNATCNAGRAEMLKAISDLSTKGLLDIKAV